MPYTVNGNTIETDEEGYLMDLSLWSQDIAAAIAEAEQDVLISG